MSHLEFHGLKTLSSALYVATEMLYNAKSWKIEFAVKMVASDTKRCLSVGLSGIQSRISDLDGMVNENFCRLNKMQIVTVRTFSIMKFITLEWIMMTDARKLPCLYHLPGRNRKLCRPD